jgi:hypothetical protein
MKNRALDLGQDGRGGVVVEIRPKSRVGERGGEGCSPAGLIGTTGRAEKRPRATCKAITVA